MSYLAHPTVRRKDEERYGKYQTKRLVLEKFDEMARTIAGGPAGSTEGESRI
jgi:hypothetical protein